MKAKARFISREETTRAGEPLHRNRRIEMYVLAAVALAAGLAAVYAAAVVWAGT